MLWSLISSAYIIYLYRKLKAEQEPQTTEPAGSESSSLAAELDRIGHQLDSLEARLASIAGPETVR